MAEVREGVSLFGDSSPVRKEATLASRIEAGESGSPVIKHPPRKMALRSVTSRGRLAKSRPKSPLMRMAEMRKGGLRGKALRQSGLKVLEGSVFKSGKRGRNLQSLAPIPECDDSNDALVEVMEEEDGTGVAGVVSILRDSSAEGGSPPPVQIPAGDLSDLALDLITSQPLQEMEFIGEQIFLATLIEAGAASGKDCMAVETSLQARTGENILQRDLPPEIVEEFPPLSKEGLRVAKEKGRFRGAGGNEPGGGLDHQPKGKMDKNKEGPMGSLNFKGESSKWAGGKNFKDLLADGVKAKAILRSVLNRGRSRSWGCRERPMGCLQSNFQGQKLPSLRRRWVLLW